jgi:hypothetical protein
MGDKMITVNHKKYDFDMVTRTKIKRKQILKGSIITFDGNTLP